MQEKAARPLIRGWRLVVFICALLIAEAIRPGTYQILGGLIFGIIGLFFLLADANEMGMMKQKDKP